jgi:nicotinamidase/pyrazinamidase
METFSIPHYDQINLIAVDVQNDFCPSGSLAVAEGDLVVPALNKVMHAMKGPHAAWWTGRDYANFENQIIATRDWHPTETNHFSPIPDYSTNWPVHCVAGTEGAAFHPDLELREHSKMVRVISKGTKKDEDAYSGFMGTTELGVPTAELLSPNRVRTALLIGGLATDYCVRATVLDARKLGYDTYVLSDAIRGVALESSEEAIEQMKAAGAQFITSSEVVAEYERMQPWNA